MFRDTSASNYLQHLQRGQQYVACAGFVPAAVQSMKQSYQVWWRITAVVTVALTSATGQEGPTASQLSTGAFSPKGSAVRAVAPLTAALAPVSNVALIALTGVTAKHLPLQICSSFESPLADSSKNTQEVKGEQWLPCR